MQSVFDLDILNRLLSVNHSRDGESDRHTDRRSHSKCRAAKRNTVGLFRSNDEALTGLLIRCVIATFDQVVTMAVYIYLIASFIGRRSIQSGLSGSYFDMFPILTFMEYFFYMGWLKVEDIRNTHPSIF